VEREREQRAERERTKTLEGIFVRFSAKIYTEGERERADMERTKTWEGIFLQASDFRYVIYYGYEFFFFFFFFLKDYGYKLHCSRKIGVGVVKNI
jgi:hypothetical protein